MDETYLGRGLYYSSSCDGGSECSGSVHGWLWMWFVGCVVSNVYGRLCVCVCVVWTIAVN